MSWKILGECQSMLRPKEKNMLTFLLRAFFSLIVGLFLGIIGWIVGAWFGGNLATWVLFNGVQGYEATGQIGFILFALVGMVTCWRYMEKRMKEAQGRTRKDKG
jgi:phosphotransferase system  glucose/maltose/N-acetylglucosamine-specific IIC component